VTGRGVVEGVQRYFGWGDAAREADARRGLDPARSWLLVGGLWGLALAVVSGIAVVTWLEWDAKRMLVGVPIGIVLWGGLAFIEVRQWVPQGRDDILDPPGDLALERGRGRLAWRLLALAPVCVGAAWLADRLDLGPVFVPGQWAGFAVANFIGAALVARWERRDGRRLLARQAGDGTRLYARG
jgi:hypothetical protein